MKDQPHTPQRPGLLAGLGALAFVTFLLLALVWGVAAAIKWM